MKVVLLAGGKGTRLSEETSIKPKPMVTIGGRPILEHIMHLYAKQGFNDFVVACGHLGWVIKEHFANYQIRQSDVTIDLSTGQRDVLSGPKDSGRVTLIDTGLDTMTGGRLARLQPLLGGSTFMLTYGDGIADIDIVALLDSHRRSGRLVTVTAVRPPARFGSLVIADDGAVTAFEEKITGSESFINGGFFVMEPGVFEYLGDDAMPLERKPMERLAADGQLNAFQHPGFWKAMDTLRDKLELESMWGRGDAPWA